MKAYWKILVAVGAVIFVVNTGELRAEGSYWISEVEVPVEVLLAPTQGFDDNDNVVVVLHGDLKNSCYTLGRHQITRVDSTTFDVHQYAYKDTTGVCAEESQLSDVMKMRVPFMTEVSIGQLEKGSYTFTFNPGHLELGMRKISVDKATSATIDSLPYALVTNVAAPSLINGSDNLKVTLNGMLNSTCTYLDPNIEIRREGDVIVVLPQIKVKPNMICAQILVPFEKKLNLGKLMPGRHYLVHIRSMNGKAVNHVVLGMR